MHRLISEYIAACTHVTLMYWIYRIHVTGIYSVPSDTIYFFLVFHPLCHAATLIFSGEPVVLYRRRKKLARKKKGYAAQLFRRLPAW